MTRIYSLLQQENENLKSNTAYLEERLDKAEKTKKLYDSAIKMQKGSIGQRNRFVANLIYQITDLNDQNQQLRESVSQLNATAAGMVLNGNSTLTALPDGTLTLKGGILPGQIFPSTIALDGGAHIGLPANLSGVNNLNGIPLTLDGNSLSKPLYIMDTSTAIYKMLNKKN
jgi:hypothetical protein